MTGEVQGSGRWRVTAGEWSRQASTPNATTPNAQVTPNAQLPKRPRKEGNAARRNQRSRRRREVGTCLLFLGGLFCPWPFASFLGSLGRWALGVTWALGVVALGIDRAAPKPPLSPSARHPAAG